MKRILFLMIIMVSIISCQTDDNKQQEVVNTVTTNQDSITFIQAAQKYDSLSKTTMSIALSLYDTIANLKKQILTHNSEVQWFHKQLEQTKQHRDALISKENINAAKNYANSGLLVERLSKNLEAQEKRNLNTINNMQSKIDALSEENLKLMNEVAECQYKLANKKEDE